MDITADIVTAFRGTVEVDGRQNWKDDLFVKAGWLKLSEPEPVKAEPEKVEPQETRPTRRKR